MVIKRTLDNNSTSTNQKITLKDQNYPLSTQKSRNHHE